LAERYFTEPYRFIPPYRSTRWCRLARFLMPRHLRRAMGVRLWHFEGAEHLEEARRRGAGVLLASNHCRRADPVALAMLGLHVKQFFYYVVAYHQFRQGRLLGWWVNRIGGFSILREGADREALRASARILAEGERPLVLFPEGTWFRQNDRLGPLQEGAGLIARHAARQTDRPVLVHPVAVKYWLLADPRPALRQRLEGLERRIGWHPQRELDLLPRIEKLGAALLALKETEYLDRPRTGPLDERIRFLTDARVTHLEEFYLGKTHNGWLLERIRRLRQRLVPRLAEVAADAEAARATREALDSLLFCENLGAHSLEYLHEHPSLERLTETVERIEETVTDEVERPVAPMGAAIAVGPALDIRAFTPARGPERTAGDPFTVQLGEAIQALLDRLLAQGPPAAWNCPAANEPRGGPAPPPLRPLEAV
jgi:1-acyl-sn-glycerol-3-phosphate acyltransferase